VIVEPANRSSEDPRSMRYRPGANGWEKPTMTPSSAAAVSHIQGLIGRPPTSAGRSGPLPCPKPPAGSQRGATQRPVLIDEASGAPCKPARHAGPLGFSPRISDSGRTPLSLHQSQGDSIDRGFESLAGHHLSCLTRWWTNVSCVVNHDVSVALQNNLPALFVAGIVSLVSFAGSDARSQ
jgi:hypothetical protein